MSTESTQPVPSAVEDRTVAILSYLTIVGFIVAIVLHSNKKTQLGAYHLRQVLGIFITGLVVGVVALPVARIPVLGPLTLALVWIGLLVMWLMGLINAATGQQKPAPILGEKYQSWFANTFA